MPEEINFKRKCLGKCGKYFKPDHMTQIYCNTCKPKPMGSKKQ